MTKTLDLRSFFLGILATVSLFALLAAAGNDDAGASGIGRFKIEAHFHGHHHDSAYVLDTVTGRVGNRAESFGGKGRRGEHREVTTKFRAKQSAGRQPRCRRERSFQLVCSGFGAASSALQILYQSSGQRCSVHLAV